MPELVVNVADWEKGDPRGRDDRAVREVAVSWVPDEACDSAVIARFGFSANWSPHGFEVEPCDRGAWDALLSYTVAGERRGMYFDFDASPELRKVIRDYLCGAATEEELVGSVRPAGAHYDSIRRRAWLDCGCGFYTSEPNTTNWHADTVKALEHELLSAGYTIAARCPHLEEAK